MTRASKEEILQAFRTLGNLVQEAYGIPKEELLAETGIFVPATIFKNNLSPFSSLATFLAQEISTKEVAKLLRRNKTFVENSIQEGEFDITGTRLPVEIFSGELSVLESTCHYLKTLGKSNMEIATEIGKSASAVWMLLKRAQEKIGGDQ